jgi:outer membrane protein OmpA-like peptidoglycan-associated protein
MKAVISFVVLLSSLAWAAGPKTDVPGSADHPLLTRYPGSVIVKYQQVAFDEYVVPLGKAVGAATFEKSEKVAGTLTSFEYVSDDARSVLEIFDNYAQALQRAGFEVSFTCVKKPECGTELGRYMKAVWYEDSRYLAARGGDPAAPTYVAVFVHKRGSSNTMGVQLRIIETRPMQAGRVTATAAAIQQGLSTQGKFALYGLHFDTGKAELKAESAPALAEVAAVLKSNPALELLVVGHTDSAGPIGANVDLSERRAAAAVQALVSQHGIAARRLTAKGVGPFAPVGTNQTEDGRAKNRRVELVEP